MTMESFESGLNWVHLYIFFVPVHREEQSANEFVVALTDTYVSESWNREFAWVTLNAVAAFRRLNALFQSPSVMYRHDPVTSHIKHSVTQQYIYDARTKDRVIYINITRQKNKNHREYMLTCAKKFVYILWVTGIIKIYRMAQKTGTLYVVRLNFVRYWPIFELISLTESGEHL